MIAPAPGPPILRGGRSSGYEQFPIRVDPWIDRMTLQRLSPRSVRAFFRKGDAVRFTVVAVLDDTARALTWEQAGTDIDARSFNDRLVFRRQ